MRALIRALKKLKLWTNRLWKRALIVCLACLFMGLAVFFTQTARYGWNRNWYTGGSRDFADSSVCEHYVQSCTAYVYNYMTWKGEVTEEVVTGYSGPAYGCVITDLDTGEVIFDNTLPDAPAVGDWQDGTYVGVQTETEPADAAVTDSSEELDADTASAEMQTVSVESSEEAPETEAIPAAELLHFRVQGYLGDPTSPYSGCYAEYRIHGVLTALADWAIPLGILCYLLSAAALALMVRWLVSRRPKESLLSRIPFDVMVVALVLLVLLADHWVQGCLRTVAMRISGYNYNVYNTLVSVLAMPTLRGLVWPAAGLCLAGALTEGLQLRCLRRRLLVSQMPMFGGIILCMALMGLFNILIFWRWRQLNGYYGGMIILPMANVAMGFVALGLLGVFARKMKKLRQASEKMASGDLEQKVDAESLPRGLREQGEALNRLSEGMKLAVEERIRGERFKTELITNVSHDLKTPLTSIVSYVDLLKKEDISPDRAKEYIEVIDRQSGKLKKLTEDLVEASKASSGSIEVKKEKVDVAELLNQSLGEFSEKLTAAELAPVLSLPETGCVLYTDGRLLWRVLDNLIQNIVKYAQPGTRVYFDLEKTDRGLAIRLKNTSAQPLNIPARALMERFVRGDGSRHTEGSGLGLSIAQSLTELLGGRMEIYLDGDLFKVTLLFEGDAVI